MLRGSGMCDEPSSGSSGGRRASRHQQHYQSTVATSHGGGLGPGGTAGIIGSTVTGTAGGGNEVEAEMRVYLDKLREIVPLVPRHRRVTRLELIQHVIDYICDLQQALEDHPALKDEPSMFLTPPTSPHHPQTVHQHPLTPPRQPLGVLATPNTLHHTPLRRDVTKTTSRLTSPISHVLPGGT